MDTLNLLNNTHQEQGDGWYSNLPRAVYEMNQKEHPLTGISAASRAFDWLQAGQPDRLVGGPAQRIRRSRSRNAFRGVFRRRQRS